MISFKEKPKVEILPVTTESDKLSAAKVFSRDLAADEPQLSEALDTYTKAQLLHGRAVLEGVSVIAAMQN